MQKFNSNIYFLLFNSLDQKSLRLEKYIHLRDAIVNKGHTNDGKP